MSRIMFQFSKVFLSATESSIQVFKFTFLSQFILLFLIVLCGLLLFPLKKTLLFWLSKVRGFSWGGRRVGWFGFGRWRGVGRCVGVTWRRRR